MSVTDVKFSVLGYCIMDQGISNLCLCLKVGTLPNSSPI